MKCSFSFVFVLVVTLSQSSKIDKIVKESSGLGRLVNSILLNDALRKSANEINYIISNVLLMSNIGSIENLNLQSAENEIQEVASKGKLLSFNSTFCKMSSNGFYVLMEMSKIRNEIQSVLHPNFMENIARIALPMSSTYFPMNGAREIRRTSNDIIEFMAKRVDGKTIGANITAGENQLKELEKHRRTWNYLKNIDLNYSDVVSLRETVKVAKKFMENRDGVSNIQKCVENVKSEIDKILEYTGINSTVLNLVKSLETLIEIVKQSNQLVPSNEWTMGFPRGVVDLEQVRKDLKEEWMEKLISDGKSLKKLSVSLSSLNNFTEKLTKLDDNWKMLNSPDMLDQLNIFISKMNKTASGVTLPKVSVLTGSMKNVSNCLATIDAFFNVPHMEIWESLSRNLSVISKWGGKIENKDTTSTLSKLNSFSVMISVGDDENLRALYSNIGDELKPFELAFEAVSEVNPLLPGLRNFRIQEIQSIFSDPKLLQMIDCLQSGVFDVNGVQRLLEWGELIGALKNEHAPGSPYTFINNLKNVKQNLDMVKTESVKISQTSTKRRNKNNDEINLKNAKKLSFDLGVGVGVLKMINDVWNHRKSVEKIGRVGPEVDSIIKDANLTIWTKEKKRGLLKLIGEVNTFNSEVEVYKGVDLMELKFIFEKATEVKGLPLDAHIFKNLSGLLESSQNPEIRRISEDFKNSSILQLDFVRHRSELVAASQTIFPLREFFDSYFGIQRVSKESPAAKRMKQGDNASGKSWILSVLMSLGVILLVGLTISVIMWRYYQNPIRVKSWFLSEQNLMNEIKNGRRYMKFLEMKLLFGNYNTLLEAVKAGDFKRSREFLHKGASVNCSEQQNKSLLHIAAQAGNADLVRLLITYGGNREAVDQMNENPEKSVSRLILSHPDENNLKDVIKVFNDVRNKRYLPKLPALLDTSQFRVFLLVKIPHEKFVEKCGKLIITEDPSICTHLVANTDDDGVWNLNQATELRFFTSAAIMMKQTWLENVVKSKKELRNDHLHRIESVRIENVGICGGIMELHDIIHTQELFLPLHGMVINFETLSDREKINNTLDPFRDNNLIKFFERFGAQVKTSKTGFDKKNGVVVHSHPGVYDHFPRSSKCEKEYDVGDVLKMILLATQKRGERSE